MRKILQQEISKWQIALVMLASILGMVCMGLPMMLADDATQMLQHEHRLFDEKFLVLNKRVTVMNTLGVGDTGFSPAEVDSLRRVKGVEKVGTFESNAFEIWAEANFGGAQVLRTQMFLEGVEDEFIDDPPPGWFWSEGQEEVPIMVPTDYLALYNFGFAPGQNLPGISKDLARQSTFTLNVSGNGKHAEFVGRIAGFSDRIETILAPKSFLIWANAQFAPHVDETPKRVIVKAAESVALQSTMMDRGYETNKERLQSVRFQQLVRQAMGSFAILGMVLLLLAIGSFILFSTLLVTRSEQRLQTLFLLGYTRRELALLVGRKVLIFPVIAFVLAVPTALFLRWCIVNQLRVFIGDISWWPGWLSLLGMLVVLVVFATFALLDMWRQLTLIQRPRP
jgi:hypothetical protein